MKNGMSEIKFNVDNANKKVEIIFDGFIDSSESEVAEFYRQYGEVKKKYIDGTLCLDVRSLRPFSQDALGALGDAFEDYATFNKCLMILPDNVVAKGQIKRVVKERNLDSKIIFVSSF